MTIAHRILSTVAEFRRKGTLDTSLCWPAEELERLAMFAIDAKNKLAAQPPPDPEVIREALDCEFRRIGIHHPLEILHRVACCAADALQRVANPDLVRSGVPREETNPHE